MSQTSLTKSVLGSIDLKLAASREGDNVVIRCCTIHRGDVQFFTVVINIPQLVRQLEALGFNATTVSGFGGWLKKAVRSVGRSKILKGVAKAVTTPIKIAVRTATAPIRLAASVVRGERIDKAMLKSFNEQIRSVKEIAPYVQTVLSFVPVVGTGINAGLGAGLALAQGKPITEALLAGVKGALPGGPLAAAAFDVASAAVRGKPILDVALSAIPLQGQQKQLLTAGLKAAAQIAQGKRVDQALMNQADAAMSLLPADAQKALKIGLALGKGQVLQAAAQASSMIPGAALSSTLKHVSPQAMGAISLANKTLGVIKTGNSVMRAAQSATRIVNRGKAAAGLVRAGKVTITKARPLITSAVKARSNVTRLAPALSNAVKNARAVKNSLQKVSIASKAGNADARFTQAAILRTAQMKEQVSRAAQQAMGGTAGLVIDAQGRLKRSPKGRWSRATALGATNEMLYTGPKTTPLRGAYSAVSGLPSLPKLSADIKAIKAAARGAEMAGQYQVAARLYMEAAKLELQLGTQVNGEPAGCPLSALGIPDQAATDADIGFGLMVQGQGWGETPPDPEGDHGPLYPVRYNDPEAWPNNPNAPHVQIPVSGAPSGLALNALRADAELRRRTEARRRARAVLDLARARHHLSKVKSRTKVGNMSGLTIPEIIGAARFKPGTSVHKRNALQKKIDAIRQRPSKPLGSMTELQRELAIAKALREMGGRISGDSDLPDEMAEQSDGIGCGEVSGFPAYLLNRARLPQATVKQRVIKALQKMPPKMRRRVIARLKTAAAAARVSGAVRNAMVNVGSHRPETWPTIGSHYAVPTNVAGPLTP